MPLEEWVSEWLHPQFDKWNVFLRRTANSLPVPFEVRGTLEFCLSDWREHYQPIMDSESFDRKPEMYRIRNVQTGEVIYPFAL